MPKIMTLTLNPAVDKSSRVDSVASEIKMRCAPPTFDPGGGGINVSRAVKKLGGESTAVYTAGGGAGQMLQSLLEAENVGQRPVPISNLTRENLVIYEEASGLQYRFGMPGAALYEQEWQRCVEIITEHEAAYVVASGSLPPGAPTDFYAQLADALEDTASKLIIDTSGDALKACRQANAYLMKPNLRELQQLTGESFQRESDIVEMARQLIEAGMAEVMVVSMGASGAMLITAELAVQMRPPVVPIESKVGAGDSMVGGIVWALADGNSLEEAARYGIAAGTAAVMTPGTELCRRDDTMRLYDEIAVLKRH